jgi:signal transduction histidine kinase
MPASCVLILALLSYYLMTSTTSKKLWIPYLIAILGTAFSVMLWMLNGKQALIGQHPLLDLCFSISIFVLLAIVVWFAQANRLRAKTLRRINKDLRKEIGERIAAEESKQKLEVALLQGQKLQAIGTLAGGIAHDFNNILYAVLGYVEMARDDVAKDSIVYKNLGKVLDAAHRGQELIARILAFSRRQHHQFEAVHLRETIEAVLALLRPTIPASVIIHFEPKIDVTILGDQTQIHQILVNFINNSVDAMEGEGNIFIHLEQVAKNSALLKQLPEVLPGKNYCKIEVTDTGHGMDQHTMERIYEPFFTTKEVGKGTGLGLSIVHSIVKEHHGEITVSSRLGQGTTFIILLPEYKEAT